MLEFAAMPDPARVRYAPSPTGHTHIGGARTALYNYLLARQTGGQFILRIEDTDSKRSARIYEDEILAALRWLGLEWDEGPDKGGPVGPYRQSERKAIYLEHARKLIDSGHAYRCFCTRERLDQVRKELERTKQLTRYDRRCRALAPAESERRAAAGEPHVVRFRAPETGTTTVEDHLRGPITIENRTLDDMILVKSDGLALYHLASVVDDHAMRITHVLRGLEWLGTFPLHALITRALGFQEPVWCHLSVFLKPAGKGKMSKRDLTSEQSIYVIGAQGLADAPATTGLRELGYVPEAVRNWVALMGASFGDDEEVLSLDEMCARFRLDRLNAAPARVSYEKLDHFNGLYLRRLPPAELAARIAPYFTAAGLPADGGKLEQIAPLIQERIVTLPDAVTMAGFFFQPEVDPTPEDLVAKGLTPAESRAALARARATLAGLGAFDHTTTEPALRALADELGVKPGQLFGILRVAATGQTVSPPLFETLALLGRETTLVRLDRAAERLAAIPA
jgi:glutamyl-tRNA synthetase